ncbi:MAG TPA: hypothetical protein VGP93_16650, partial [Polyangiaceae bacterium]|nr:hypothetical protein [Polyangiaceae bacterium]
MQKTAIPPVSSVWRFDPARAGNRHAFAPGFGHSVGVPLVLGVYRMLGLSGSLHAHRSWWHIHVAPNVILTEIEYGVEVEREAHNERCFADVAKHGQTVRAEFAGYRQLYVPVRHAGRHLGLLTTGPFGVTRPTGQNVLDGWHRITGRQGHPADPGFASYLSLSLSTLVLEDGRDLILQKILERVGSLIAGDGDAATHVNEAEVLQAELWPVRKVERTWTAVETMLDERSSRELYSNWRTAEL